MGGKSGGGTTNTVAEPWAGQQPYLTDVFQQANTMYYGGYLAPEYYGGNTVAGQSPYTTQAYGIVSNQANFGDNSYGSMRNAMTTTNNVLNRGISGNTGLTNLNRVGDTNAANKGLGYLNGYTGQNTLAGDTGYNKLVGYSGQNFNNNVGQNALASMTNAVNPYSQKLLGQAIDQETGKLNGNFSQAGRYGSGAHENAVADAATNLTNQFYSNAYDQQMQAAQNYANNYTANIGQNINAAQGANQAYQTDQGNKLSAAQQAAQAYNTGVGNNIAAMNDAAGAYNNGLQAQNQAALNSKDLYNQRYTDAQWLSDIGANQENYNQALIDAAIDRYNYNSQRPLTALSNYNQLIQGTYGGTTTSTGKSGYTGSALGSAIGGATAAAGLANALGGSDGLLSYF